MAGRARQKAPLALPGVHSKGALLLTERGEGRGALAPQGCKQLTVPLGCPGGGRGLWFTEAGGGGAAKGGWEESGGK